MLSVYKFKELGYMRWRDAGTWSGFSQHSQSKPLGLTTNRTLLEISPLLCVNLIRVPRIRALLLESKRLVGVICNTSLRRVEVSRMLAGKFD